MANGDILDTVQDTITKALEMGKLTVQDRATLEALKYLVVFSRQSQADHEKINVMWPAYLWGKWAIVVVVGIGIADLTTRFFSLIAKP